jgi:hypothetical protein
MMLAAVMHAMEREKVDCRVLDHIDPSLDGVDASDIRTWFRMNRAPGDACRKERRLDAETRRRDDLRGRLTPDELRLLGW